MIKIVYTLDDVVFGVGSLGALQDEVARPWDFRLQTNTQMQCGLLTRIGDTIRKI